MLTHSSPSLPFVSWSREPICSDTMTAKRANLTELMMPATKVVSISMIVVNQGRPCDYVMYIVVESRYKTSFPTSI